MCKDQELNSYCANSKVCMSNIGILRNLEITQPCIESQKEIHGWIRGSNLGVHDFRLMYKRGVGKLENR
ncbi:hypothetical protein TNCV_2499961 [Trichonephila clavipes]|nr:hypothetical protein TNCV_2499961 [Trichonephila clavipes]